MNEKLVFDLGYHVGNDTDYYLSKGFNVVAVEANPRLVTRNLIYLGNTFNKDTNRANVINKAIVGDNDFRDRISFYINKSNLDWSSCNKEVASHNMETECVEVETIKLKDLIQKFGVPYYIKVDVEGMDLEVSNSLYNLIEKPKYVSFELNKKDYINIFNKLYSCGYKYFQLRNQNNNKEYSSGDFGEFLPNDNWICYEECFKRYMMFRELRDKDYENLSFGWLDLHAKIGE